MQALTFFFAFVAVLALKENPLRAHFHAEQAARAGLHARAGGPAASVAPQ